jgi:multiple sugar transport system ATP-binding protein
VASGEFLVLVGPSGCGKSTLLNVIAGLETITSGEIRIENRLVNNVNPKDRDIAMVFQSYALYPNMNVRRNLSFGLETRKVPKEEIKATVARVSQMLQIENLLNRKPSQLSGGQRQRVAMGRALARNPRIFLFDEPLSNLDAKLRVEMRTEIKRLHQRIKTTIVYVTHDQIEAMTLADRIAVMKDGLLQQFDTPQQVYENPANQFVAGFMGSPSMNFIPCRIEKRDGSPGFTLESEPGHGSFMALTGDRHGLDAWVDKPVLCGIRPEHLTDRPADQENDRPVHTLQCHAHVLEPTGPDTLLFTTINDQDVTCRIHPGTSCRAGDRITLVFDLAKALFFDPATGERIR